jgi:transcriptional regulator with XRE-family HTH domain
MGETQEGMARRLGVSLSGYKFWEAGSRTPSAGWILKLQALCPNEETRGLLSLRFEAPRADPKRESDRELTEVQEKILRDYNDAATGLNILYEVADAGNRGAAEALRKFAEQINKTAGDWRRMKYLRK